MMQLHGFYNVSGYCYLIPKFPVVPPDAKKWGSKKYARFARRMFPHFQTRGAALDNKA